MFHELGNYPEVRNRYSEVRVLWQELLRTEPNSTAEFLQGLTQTCEATLGNPTELNLHERYVGLGVLLQESGKFSEAEEAFKRANQFEPAMNASIRGSPSTQAIAANARLSASPR